MEKKGAVGYIWLSSDFEKPRWREALIVGERDSWVQTLVRCSQKEIEASGLSSCKAGQQCYCLVEAKPGQVRLGPPSDVTTTLKLETDRKALIRAGQDLLSADEDLAYATASEPPAPAKRKPLKKTVESSDSELSDSLQGDGVDDLVAKMRQNWLGSGTDGGEAKDQESKRDKKKSKRFALIEKTRKKRDEDEDQLKQLDIVRMLAGTKEPLTGLLAVQLAQSLAKKEKKKKSRRHQSSSSSNSRSISSGSDSSNSTGSTHSRGRGHAKAVSNLQATKRRMFRKPLKYVRRYVKGIEQELGAQDKPFRVVDYTRRIPFGKQRNLQRCHYLFGIVLEMLLTEDYHRAALQTTLCLQALHQAALDSDWTVAWLLTHTPDPYEKKQFGGDPKSLQDVTAYIRSAQDLSKSAEALKRRAPGRQGDEPEEEKPKAKGKGKGNKHKDAKESVEKTES